MEIILFPTSFVSNTIPPPPDIKTWSSITFRNFKKRQNKVTTANCGGLTWKNVSMCKWTGVSEAATCPLVILAP